MLLAVGHDFICVSATHVIILRHLHNSTLLCLYQKSAADFENSRFKSMLFWSPLYIILAAIKHGGVLYRGYKLFQYDRVISDIKIVSMYDYPCISLQHMSERCTYTKKKQQYTK